jgi:alkylation response protein AidB-like acyl-CoA dehydrogenase
LTEPGGGTDLAAMQTVASKAPGGFRLRGEKVFISHAAHAGLFFLVASIDPSRQHAGVTAFLVDVAATKGIEISALPMRTLQRDNLATVRFDDAFVPDDAVLGSPGAGFPILGSALDMGRFSVAARCVGQAQRCLDLALPYASERRAFGKPIGEHQLIQHKLAQMVARTEQARLLVYRLGRMKDAGLERCSLEASLAKLCASQAAVQNALDGIQIFGAYGLSADHEIGRLLLEAKALEIGEGTSELHEKLIAEYALGMR